MNRAILLACTVLALGSVSSVDAALVFQATTPDYNPSTNAFVPDVGPTGAYNVDETTAGHQGLSIAANATQNGSSAFAFDGTSGVQFPANIVPTAGAMTILAVLKPNSDYTSPQTIVAGGSGSVQFRIDDNGVNAGEMGVLSRGNFQFGNSSQVVDPSTFSVVDLTLTPGSPSASFYINGSYAGDAGANYNPAGLFGISRFGEAQNSADGSVNDEYFRGQIAELLVYDTALSTTDRQAVEAQLTAQFITPVPEPASLGLLVTSGIALLARRRRVV